MSRTSTFIIVAVLIVLSLCSCQKSNIGTGEFFTPRPPASDAVSSDTDKSENVSAQAYTDLEITEVMPSNGAVLRDSYGYFSDWIEIHNAGDLTVQLKDFYLSDDSDDLTKWQFPSGELAPNEYVIVFASSAESQDGELHAPFKLSKDGESIFLTHISGGINSTLTYADAEKNMSVLPDGTMTHFATPGFANDDAGYADYMRTLTLPVGLCITEAMNANSTYIPHDGTHSDWVELYNNSDTPIDLGSYCLSDDSDDLTKCILPDITVNPHSYCTIFCDDKNPHFKSFVTGFSLGSDDDIFLSQDGIICDFITLCEIPYGASFGRASAGYAYFTSPTPGSANGSGTAMITAMPRTSIPQGVYNDVSGFSIELSGEGDIYYTTDGSEPTRSSHRFSEPLNVTRTTVVRARAYKDGKLDSRIMTASFIINENHTLPVLSLATDEDNLFDPETGIYVKGNHENYYQDWEKSANLTMFEDGETKFCADCGLKMFGSGSRADCEKKSLRVNFKAKYGMSKLKCDVFSDGITGYKSLVMRAGEDAQYSIFRNEVFTTLAKATNLLVQNNKYCILYVDGEYFGIFCLCERFSKTYYAQHHDIDENLVEVYGAPTSSDTKIGKLMTYAKTHDMSKDESYSYMKNHLDIDGMIDWFVMQAYTHNRDLGGNLRYIYRADTDYIEYAFYDLDWAFYRRESRFSILTDGEQYSIIIHAMLKNAKFRERFVKRTGELLGGVLRDSNVLSVISYYEELIRPEIVRERARWKGTEADIKTPESWQRAVDRMKKYVTQSSIKEEMIDSLRTYIHLTDEEAAIIRNG